MDLTRNAITNIKTIDRLNSDVDIYPNPANNRLYINLKDSKPASVQINNLNGQPLLLKQLNNQIETIDISKFAKGIYLIKIIKNNTIIVRKVVFQ
jgi:glutaredoxin-related protein